MHRYKCVHIQVYGMYIAQVYMELEDNWRTTGYHPKECCTQTLRHLSERLAGH